MYLLYSNRGMAMGVGLCLGWGQSTAPSTTLHHSPRQKVVVPAVPTCESRKGAARRATHRRYSGGCTAPCAKAPHRYSRRAADVAESRGKAFGGDAPRVRYS